MIARCRADYDSAVGWGSDLCLSWLALPGPHQVNDFLLTDTEVRSSKYLNNLIEQDHRSVKQRIAVMVGFKRFRNAAITIAGFELMHRIRKGQFALGHLELQGRTAPATWDAVLGS
jgi:transposase-like protein